MRHLTAAITLILVAALAAGAAAQEVKSAIGLDQVVLVGYLCDWESSVTPASRSSIKFSLWIPRGRLGGILIPCLARNLKTDDLEEAVEGDLIILRGSHCLCRGRLFVLATELRRVSE